MNQMDMSKMGTEGEESISKEKSFLRFGGIAGILAGIFFILTIITLAGFGPSTTATAADRIANFPNARTALSLGNGFYFLVSVWLVGLALGLHRALRGKTPALALFGAVLFLLGIGVTFIDDTTQIAFAPLSDLYHAAGTTAADQHSLTLMWQATQGMFNEFDVSATILIATAFIVLGVAMFRAPTFGKVFGGLSAAFGAAQIIGVTLYSTNSAAYAPFALLAFLVFPILFGWKLYRLSRAA